MFVQDLVEFATQPEFVHRHVWQVNDLVIWDNQATMHYATDDYGSESRRMRRVTLAGTIPVGPNGAHSRIAVDPLVAVR